MAEATPLAAARRDEIPDDLEAAILALKEERNAVLLAHYYQESEVQDLADFVGDSLALAQAATKVDRDVIAFCGVHFMAETAKILNPERIVVVPDLEAGCSLADGCPPDEFQAFKDAHPDAKVLSYINCSAEVKAMSDLICTSSNAVKMAKHFDDQPLIFAPDRHLARWVARQLGRDDLIVWQGTCIVHEQFTAKRLAQLCAVHPEAEVLAHPECDQAVLDQADFIASDHGHHRPRGEEPREDADHRHRGRRVPPDPEARAREAADPGARHRRELRVQPVPVHAQEHAREALPVPARSAPADRGARADPRRARCARSGACSSCRPPRSLTQESH